MQGVRHAVRHLGQDRASGGDEGLRRDLTAEDPAVRHGDALALEDVGRARPELAHALGALDADGRVPDVLEVQRCQCGAERDALCLLDGLGGHGAPRRVVNDVTLKERWVSL
uniref:Uncharacterized protein n=1 Tax=Janibacter limosus TaxID=53458 RepID=A0AC61U8L3_9MICO|nr:hypothetical protein [Janibacter limosus]